VYGRSVIDKGTLPTICRQCDMRCGIEVGVEQGRITRITGMKAHPQNRGRLCPKGPAAVDTVYHPERLLKPLKKTSDGSFQEISLEQAMGEISDKLAAIGERHGRRSIAAWHGEALGFAQQEMYPRRFLHALGSPNFLSVNSLCYVSRYIAYRLVQGYWNACPDFRNARCILLWGTNPPLSHFTFMHPIEEARARGAKLVVIDPRSTEISRKADLHLRLLPGTDGALAWGLMRRLIETGHYDREFVARHSLGFEEASAYSQGFTTEVVSGITGLSPEQIEECGRLIVAGRGERGAGHRLPGGTDRRTGPCGRGPLARAAGGALPHPLRPAPPAGPGTDRGGGLPGAVRLLQGVQHHEGG